MSLKTKADPRRLTSHRSSGHMPHIQPQHLGRLRHTSLQIRAVSAVDRRSVRGLNLAESDLNDGRRLP